MRGNLLQPDLDYFVLGSPILSPKPVETKNSSKKIVPLEYEMPESPVPSNMEIRECFLQSVNDCRSSASATTYPDLFDEIPCMSQVPQETNPHSVSELDQLTIDEVDAILNFVAQDGQPEPMPDQEVPNTDLYSMSVQSAIPKKLTYAQKLKRLENPEGFEAEIQAYNRKLNRKLLKAQQKHKVQYEMSDGGIFTTLDNQGIFEPKVGECTNFFCIHLIIK